MVMIIAFISQKGGVGKSTLARALATEVSKGNLKFLLADCDPQQSTSDNWNKLRDRGDVNSKVFSDLYSLWNLVDDYDLVIIDGSARTSRGTLEIAQRTNLLIQPTNAGIDDLEPAIKEFHGLVQAGIGKDKLVLALNHLGSSSEEQVAREYIRKSSYQVLTTGLFEKVSYRQNQNQGLAITEVTYPSLQKQAKKLVEEIIDWVIK
jgi:chromosome partitioning protein